MPIEVGFALTSSREMKIFELLILNILKNRTIQIKLKKAAKNPYFWAIANNSVSDGRIYSSDPNKPGNSKINRLATEIDFWV